jgi:hypothetical protein
MSRYSETSVVFEACEAVAFHSNPVSAPDSWNLSGSKIMNSSSMIELSFVDTDWVFASLLNHYANLFGISMNYLHSTLTWSISIVVGGALALSLRPNPSDLIGVSASLGLLLVVVHLLVRTSKAYSSVIRFSTIEKHITNIGLNGNDEDIVYLLQIIENLHYRWSCPLRIRDVFYKTFFELGFIYFTFMTGIYSFYLIYISDLSLNIKLILVSVFLILLFTELLFGVVKSPYFKDFYIVQLSVDQR